MGIRGLTTFIENRSHLYLEEYELYNTNIVLDGNAIACQLYKWHCKSNDCFGGDYDKYAAVIENFFNVLSRCNVKPYVVFDGGYEARKVATIISRMKNRIKSAEQLNSVTEGSISVFPLLLRETFQDIVLKRHIKCVRCDFESDTEVANIARTLDCPVLSYDSDFFIFDVLYIPFSTFEIQIRKKRNSQTNEPYSYIRCQLYRVEKFLKSFGGLDKRSLPILAVLLGNDYVKRGVFTEFYNNLKMQKCHGGASDQQKRIKSLIVWLQNESLESAIQKVLSRYKCKKRKVITKKIKNAIKGYNCTNSIYLNYLGISPINSQGTDLQYDFEFINENIQDDELDNSVICISDSESEEQESSMDEDANLIDFEDPELNSNMPTIFVEKFRKCLYPSSFMDMLTQNKYYCVPQVENDLQTYSHAISSEILVAIHRILRTSEDNLVCVARGVNNGHVKSYPLPQCDINLPCLRDLEQMSRNAKQLLFLHVLKIDNSFITNCLDLFPESWHLFLLAIKYVIDRSVITWPIVYALVICKNFLEYVDKHVGMCRSKKTLENKFLNTSSVVSNKETNTDKITINDSLNDINFNDSLSSLKILLPYFHINLKMKTNNRLYDRNIMHTMAQFQSCLLHIKYLNNILDTPFSNCIMSDIFNGTLVYNLSVNFIKRLNLDNYIELLLRDAATIFNSVKLITDKIKEQGSISLKCDEPPKRRRKKKKRKEIDNVGFIEDQSEEEVCLDPNNKYSVLSYSEKNC